MSHPTQSKNDPSNKYLVARRYDAILPAELLGQLHYFLVSKQMRSVDSIRDPTISENQSDSKMGQ